MFSAIGCQLRDENRVPRGGKSCHGWMVSESGDVSPLLQRKLSFQRLRGPLVQTNALIQPGATFSPGRSGLQPRVSG